MIKKLHQSAYTMINVTHTTLNHISSTSLDITLCGKALVRGKYDDAVININVNTITHPTDVVNHLIRTYSLLHEIVNDGCPTPWQLSPTNLMNEDDGFDIDQMDDLHPFKWDFNQALETLSQA